MLHISRSVSEHIYGVFITLACLYQKLFIAETDGDLSWPEMTSGTGGGVTGRNALIQVEVSSLPVTRRLRVFRMFLFCPKEAPSNFLPLTYN